MRVLQSLRLRYGWLFRRHQAETDLHDELTDYVARQTERHLETGLTREQARLAALRDAGGVEQVKEACRDARGTAWIENTLQDVRYAGRMLIKNRGFAAAAICTLALGIGANTALFDVINGVILRPLPYRDPSRLLAVEEIKLKGAYWSFSYLDYLDFAHGAQSFESVGAWRNQGANLTSPGEPEFLQTRMVSASFLDVLGIRPIIGRNFTNGEDRQGAPRVAIISYPLWEQRFAGRHDVPGKTLVLNGQLVTVIGVLPAGFRFTSDARILTLIGQNDQVLMQKRELHTGIRAIARLRAGVSLEQANAECRLIGQRLAKAYPSTNADFTFLPLPLKQEIVGNLDRTLFLLGGAVGLVLLIACVNVANLFLASSVARQREFAVRTALGAGRSRLICQLLTESLLLSSIGGALGLAIAAAGTGWAIAHLPHWLPRTDEISIDLPVLLFSLCASIASGLAFGIAPGLRKRFDLEPALREGARGTTGDVRRLQSVFVIAEIALAFVLLAGSGLMLRTLVQLLGVSPGFDAHNVLTMTIALAPGNTTDANAIRNGWRQSLDRVQRVPGVEAAAIDSILPMSGDSQHVPYWTSGEADPPKDAPNAFFFTPTPNYLQVMKTPLLSGRFFNDRDKGGSPLVVVIDETLARKVSPSGAAVGRQISLQFLGKAEIVGVVAATRHVTLDEDVYANREPAVYLPFFQFPDAFLPLTLTGMNLLVRTSMDPHFVLEAVKRSVVGPGRDAPVRDVVTMEELIGSSIAEREGIAWLLAIFAALALSLAAIGIYSVISYGMNRRSQEIGIRMALGARSGQVLRLIFGQAARTIGIGVLVGLAASAALMRLLSKLLFEVSPADPVTFAAVIVSLCGVALLAVYIPARRASHTDPSVALRHE